MRFGSRPLIPFALSAAIASCGGGNDDHAFSGASHVGDLGGPCYPNSTCNAHLECGKSNTCVEAAGSVGNPCYPNLTCNAGLVCGAASICVSRAAAGGSSSGGSGADSGTAGTGGTTTGAGGLVVGGTGGQPMGGVGGQPAGGAGGAQGDSGAGGGPPTNQPPSIVSVTSGGGLPLSPGYPITITVTATDPDGNGDIAGGRLMDASGLKTLGQFTSLGGGTLSTSLDWVTLDQASPITLNMSLETRTLTAVVFDAASLEASKTFEIAITCYAPSSCSTQTPGPMLAACGADSCVNLKSDAANCGQCGRSCVPGSTCSCGSCTAAFSPCTLGTSCDVICRGFGVACLTQGCSGVTVESYSASDCSGTPKTSTLACSLTGNGVPSYLRCCCGG